MGLFNKLFGKQTKPEEAEEEKAVFLKPEAPIDLTMVYPRIKELTIINHEEESNREENIVIEENSPEVPLFKPYAEDIAVFYLVDTGAHFKMVQMKDLSEEITLEKIHDAALTNLARVVKDQTEIKGDAENIMIVTNGGNFEATMLLADYIWDELKTLLNDEVCVAIPANDLMFVSAKNNEVGRETLRMMIRRCFDEMEVHGLIVRHIYERVNNHWTIIETA